MWISWKSNVDIHWMNEWKKSEKISWHTVGFGFFSSNQVKRIKVFRSIQDNNKRKTLKKKYEWPSLGNRPSLSSWLVGWLADWLTDIVHYLTLIFGTHLSVRSILNGKLFFFFFFFHFFAFYYLATFQYTSDKHASFKYYGLVLF